MNCNNRTVSLGSMAMVILAVVTAQLIGMERRDAILLVGGVAVVAVGQLLGQIVSLLMGSCGECEDRCRPVEAAERQALRAEESSR